MHLSSVDLPEPFSPIRPNVEPAGTSRRHVAQRPELLELRPPAAHERRPSGTGCARGRAGTAWTTSSHLRPRRRRHSSSASRPCVARRTRPCRAARTAAGDGDQVRDGRRGTGSRWSYSRSRNASTKPTIGLSVVDVLDAEASRPLAAGGRVGHQRDRVDDRRRVEPDLHAGCPTKCCDVAEVHVEHRQHAARCPRPNSAEQHHEHDDQRQRRAAACPPKTAGPTTSTRISMSERHDAGERRWRPRAARAGSTPS